MGDPKALPPIVTFVGKSNSGKTTLIERLLPELTNLGLAVGTIKHDVHGFDIDIPGKDTWRHRKAGARRTVISSPTRMALIQDVDHDHRLDELIVYFQGLDLVLAEGYLRESKPKVEVFRDAMQPKPLCRGDRNLIAMVTSATLELEVPRFLPEDTAGLASFLKRHFRL